MTDLVLDNSAAIQFSSGSSTDEANAQYYAPELIDLEYASVLRKLVIRKEVAPEEAQSYLQEWTGNALIRCNHAMLLPRIWELRDNITPYDAAYVALAEILDVPLVTADRRLARAASTYCEVISIGE